MSIPDAEYPSFSGDHRYTPDELARMRELGLMACQPANGAKILHDSDPVAKKIEALKARLERVVPRRSM